MNEIDPNIYKKYREDNFSIEVGSRQDFLTKEIKIELSLSPNGRQYTTITFTRREWKKIRRSVNEFIKNLGA